ncbi:MAG TPA: hypothetical protein VML58_10500, partial [Burkholderiaceae bacterium]|nr:hypothetical protein [Burkholderiaceae bacterium]
MRIRLLLSAILVGPLIACSTPGTLRPGADLAAGCGALAAPIDASKIGLPTSGATIDSASLTAPSALAV